ncbi:MAG TPA: DNA polymerase I [Solirubrobacteraceae bacterium]|nr:DNA polymerase I [Solirubrobacteraceae bacterium]
MAPSTTAESKQGPKNGEAIANGAAGPDQRLFLIDGPSLVYRAFYALPESIATSTGEPTNAIFGFASMLVKIVTDYGVRPTIVAWDAGTSGRTEIFAEYKATRRSRPDLLKMQWPAMEPLVEAFGYRNVKLEGFEADDVIASLAERARAAGLASMIVTGDRDVFQLIDDSGLVKVMATSRGITETKIYDRHAVLDRYGIPPELIPDFYGLKGDTSDNIPGVPGIGDKTASELIRVYGSLDGVLEHVADIGGAKRKQNLLEHAEDARTSKRLATVRRDLEVDVDLGVEASREPDRSRLREFFRRYELRDPLRRLEEALGDPELAAARSAPVDGETLRARTRAGTAQDIGAFGPAQALSLVVRPREAPEGALFAEGSAWRFAATPAGVGVGVAASSAAAGSSEAGGSRAAAGSSGAGGNGAAARAAKRAAPAEVLVGDCAGPEEIVTICADRPVLVHDAKALGEIPARLAHDTLLGAYLLEPARRGYPFEELCEERGLQCQADDPLAADAVLVDALASWQRAEIGERGLDRLMADIELPLVAVLRAMEKAGVRLNCERLAEITTRVREEIVELEGEIFALAGEEFVIASPQQLGEVLFEKLGLSRKRRGKTGYSTDARVLQAIRAEHVIVARIERWRELSTLIKTYLDVLPELVDERSRIHTTFLQTVAQTGRLSSTNPNMQNVPIRTELGREIRGCFEAAPGALLISADYSQIELRVLAYAADEPVLEEIFERGEDVHTATASQVFGVTPDEIDPGMRSKSKMINYGIVYGLSDFGLADRLNIPREEAKEFIDAYLQRFPRVAAFIESTIERAREDGHVTTLWGRRRQIPELRARNYQVRTLGERLAVNTVIQGTAADIIKLAMIRCHDALAGERLETRLILTIHDELLFEGPPGEADRARALIEREMVGVWDREPAMAVDIGIGENWLEAK